MKFIIIKILKFFLHPFKDILLTLSREFIEKKIFNLGLNISNQNLKKFKKIVNLSDVEFSSFSQWGDDGIIDWLVNNLELKNKKFIEIGIQDYWECNTRFLLKKRNWNGLIIDMSKKYIENIKFQSIYWKHNLLAKQVKITKDNINKTLLKYNFEKNIGLLSLDIDGNDYWIIKELKIYADIIVCEYNGIFGDQYKITVPYKKSFDRKREHYSGLFYGCSIKALISIMTNKGYVFIGTNSAGNNAYFVKKNNYKILKNKIKRIRLFLPKFRESRQINYKKSFLQINKSIYLLRNKFVYDLSKKELIKIKKLKNIFSKEQLVYLNS